MASRADERNLNPPVSTEEHGLRAAHRRLYSLRTAARGRAAAGPRHPKCTATDVIVDFGYKSEGLVPIEQFAAAGWKYPGSGGRPDRRDDRPAGHAAGRLHAALASEGQPPAHLGQSGEGISRGPGGFRPRRWAASRAGSRWTSACRPSCPDRRSIRGRSTIWIRSSARTFRSKIVKLNRRRGNVVVSRKMAVEEEQHARKSATLRNSARRRRGHRRGQEPHRLRRFHRSGRHRRPAARQRHVLRPRHASLRSAATSATRSPSRCSSSTATRSAFRWA